MWVHPLVPPVDRHWVMTEAQANYQERVRLYDRWRRETFRVWAHQDRVAEDKVTSLHEYLESMSEMVGGEL